MRLTGQSVGDVDNAGANQCRIWRGFAARGMGENADAGNPVPTTPDVTEDYAVPAACEATFLSIPAILSLAVWAWGVPP